MIETPAAVMISDELAKEVDFFSIGTNDLTQYTLAIDRQNTKLEAFYDAHHPAVLKMIEMTIANAHKAGIWAGICGELGADTQLTKEFLAMGVDELSVSLSLIHISLHVIPACVIGSGIAGAMSMAFKCTLMAPHGGIFVVPVIGNPWMYLIALVVGMAVSTVLLGVLKKKIR